MAGAHGVAGSRVRLPPPGSGIPAPPPAAVTRPRLLAELELLSPGEEQARLLLISAPAGYGKTTLVADWATRLRRRGHRVAWVRAGPGDRATHLWSALHQELARPSGPRPPDGVGPPDVDRRDRAPRVPRLAAVVTAMAVHRAVVVIDDAHEVLDTTARHGLDDLVRRQPPGSTLVLLSRRDPVLPELTRRRLASDLHELRAADLAFDPTEMAAMYPHLGPDEVAEIWSATEGWPALVRIAAGLSTLPAGGHRHATPGPAQAGWTDGSGPAVGSILTGQTNLVASLFEDLFVRLEPDDLDALMACAVPDVLTVEAAASLTGRDDVGSLLAQVAGAWGLATPLSEHRPARGAGAGGDRDVTDGWRLHPLLRAHLVGQLRNRDLASFHRASALSARWCADSHRPEAAIGHAVASGDPAVIEDVVRRTGPGLLATGRADLLLRSLSPGHVAGTPPVPWLGALRAAALTARGHTSQAEDMIRELRPSDDPDLDALVEVVRGRVHRSARHLPGTAGAGDHLVTTQVGSAASPDAADVGSRTRPLQTDVTRPDVRILAATEMGLRHLWAHDLGSADAAFDVAADLAGERRRCLARVDALTWRSLTRLLRGETAAAETLAREALLDAQRCHTDCIHPTSAAHAVLGLAARERLDAGGAEVERACLRSALSRASEHGADSTEPSLDLLVHAVDAILRADTDRRGAAARLGDLRASARTPILPPVLALVDLACVDADLAAGDRVRAGEVVRAMRERLGPCAEVELAEATLAAAEGRHHGGSASGRRSPGWWPATEITLEVLAARRAHRPDDPYRAVEHLRAAVALADERDVLRPLVTDDPTIHELLATNRGRWGPHEELVTAALAAAPARRSRAVDLTQRELDLLRELPSLNTIGQIAAALHVSDNTVKTHLRGIYRKLEVGSRRDAVSEARRLGLI